MTDLWLGALWLLVASLTSLLRPRPRRALQWALVAVGVPLLGLLTWHHGPLAGLAAMALGTLVLWRQPARRLRWAIRVGR